MNSAATYTAVVQIYSWCVTPQITARFVLGTLLPLSPTRVSFGFLGGTTRDVRSRRGGGTSGGTTTAASPCRPTGITGSPGQTEFKGVKRDSNIDSTALILSPAGDLQNRVY